MNFEDPLSEVNKAPLPLKSTYVRNLESSQTAQTENRRVIPKAVRERNAKGALKGYRIP